MNNDWMTTEIINKMREDTERFVNLELKIFESIIWQNYSWAGRVFKELSKEKQDSLIIDLEKSLKWLRNIQNKQSNT